MNSYQWDDLDAIIKLEIKKLPIDCTRYNNHEWVNAYEPKNLPLHRLIKDTVVLQPYQICKHCFRRDNYNEEINRSTDSIN